MNRRIIIPAAGKGSRLTKSEDAPPKVMHCVGGRPLLQVVLEQTDFIPEDDTYIVVGYKKDAAILATDTTTSNKRSKKARGTPCWSAKTTSVISTAQFS